MLSFAILSALAASLPVTFASTAYVAYAWNETAPAIHNKLINAVNGQFQVGTLPTSVCPTYDPGCPSQNITIFTGPDNNRQFWLGTLAGGQQLNAAELTARFGYIGPWEKIQDYLGLLFVPFTVENDNFSNQTVLRFAGNDFVACPDGPADNLYVRPLHYGDLAYSRPDNSGPCYPFKFKLVETTAPAVDYYQW